MIKYLIMDIDGSLTDGKIYIGQSEEMMKAFSVKDGYVFKYILEPNGIRPIVITGRTSRIVINRCVELGIKDIYQEIDNKIDLLNKIIGQDNLCYCAYFGDDIPDLTCMTSIKNAGGIIGCPVDAVQLVKAKANYVCQFKGGQGALREFVEWLVRKENSNYLIDKAVNTKLDYLRQLNITENDIGKHVVNDKFFYIVQSYLTKKEEDCMFESHRRYIDIQIMIEGEEVIDISDISRLEIKEPYNEGKDLILWRPPQRSARIYMKKNDYCILYPENAHRGAIAVDGGRWNLKVVGKVAIT